jgi:hypothetical protein
MFGKLFARTRTGASQAKPVTSMPVSKAAAKPAAAPIPAIPSDEERFAAALALPDEAREAACLELALRAERAQWRLKAAQETRAAASWERLQREAKDRDRGVYKLAKDRLAEERRRSVLAQELVTHEAALLALLHAPLVDLARLVELDRQWTRMQESGARSEAIGTLRAQIDTRIDAERERQHALQSLRDAIRQTQAEVDGTQPDLPATQIRLADWASDVAALADEPGGLPAGPLKALKQEYAALQASVQTRLAEVERESRCRALLEQANALQTASETQLDALKHAWMQAAAHGSSPQLEALADEFSRRLTALRDRLKHADAQRQAARSRIEEQLGALESALADGQTRKAFEADEQLRGLAADIAALSSAAVQRRLRAAQEQVGKLRGWRRFTAVTHREELCELAEKLVGSPLPPDAVAHEITALRESWKGFDRQLGPASQSLWDRFQAATAKAYEPVKALHERQSRERAEHAAAKHATLDELRALVSSIAEGGADWKALAAKRAELVPRWYAIGPVDRKEAKRLDADWKAALKALDNALDGQRDGECRRREDLIAEVEAALEDARAGKDLAAAMETAKTAQRRWQAETTGVAVKRSLDQALWERFRAACNAVFECRDTERKEREAQRSAEREAQQAARRTAEQAALRKRDAVRDRLLQARAEDRGRYAAEGEDAAGEQAQRADLVLELEVLLGLDSPAELKKERMAKQVALLSTSLKGRAETDPAVVVGRLFKLRGQAETGLDARIDAVIEQLVGR